MEGERLLTNSSNSKTDFFSSVCNDKCNLSLPSHYCPIFPRKLPSACCAAVARHTTPITPLLISVKNVLKDCFSTWATIQITIICNAKEKGGKKTKPVSPEFGISQWYLIRRNCSSWNVMWLFWWHRSFPRNWRIIVRVQIRSFCWREWPDEQTWKLKVKLTRSISKKRKGKIKCKKCSFKYV